MLNVYTSHHANFRVHRNQYDSIVTWLNDNFSPSSGAMPPFERRGLVADTEYYHTWAVWRGQLDSTAKLQFLEYQESDDWVVSFATIRFSEFIYTYEIALKVDDTIAVQLWLLFPNWYKNDNHIQILPQR
jgi:hypothetical protein